MIPKKRENLGCPVLATAIVTKFEDEDEDSIVSLEVSGKALRVPGSESKEAFEMDAVIQYESTSNKLFEAVLAAPVSGFIDGYSACTLVIGPAAAGRSNVYSGSVEDIHGVTESDNGIVHQALAGTFAALKRKFNTLNGSGAGPGGALRYSFELFASFVEVYDDKIMDLLDVSKVGLPVKEDDWVGPAVSGASLFGPISSTESMLELFHAGQAARHQSQLTEYGPRNLFASAILSLTLVQKYSGTPVAGLAVPDEIVSRLHLVDFAGVETLSERGMVGPSQAIQSLAATATAITSQPAMDVSPSALPVDQSKVMWLLKDAFCGPALLSVACVLSSAGNAAHMCHSLSLASLLRHTCSFPVVNSIGTQVLTQRYRKLVRMLKDDGAFESGKRGSIATIGSPSVSQTTLFDLEMQKLKSDEEKQRVLQAFNDLQGKYSALVESRLKFQEDLIASEEEKVKLSQALLDLKIEHSKLQESVEKSLLSTEVSGVAQQLKARDDAFRCKQLELQLEDLQKEKDDAVEELKNLQANYASKSRDLKATMARNQDLSAEILTLVNKCGVLEERLSAASADILQAKPAFLPPQASSSESDAKHAAEIATLRVRVASLTTELQTEASSHREALLQLTSRTSGLDTASILRDLLSVHDSQERRLRSQLDLALTSGDALYQSGCRMLDEFGILRRLVAISATVDPSIRSQMESMSKVERDLARRFHSDPFQTDSQVQSLRASVVELERLLASERESATRKAMDLQQRLEREVAARKAVKTEEAPVVADAGPPPTSASSSRTSRRSVSETLESARDKEALSSLRDKLKEANRELDRLKHNFKAKEEENNMLTAAKEAKQAELLALRSELEQVRKSSHRDDTTELLAQLRQAEKRCADLLSSSKAAETELQEYQVFMKTAIPKYKKKIAKLKAELGKK